MKHTGLLPARKSLTSCPDLFNQSGKVCPRYSQFRFE